MKFNDSIYDKNFKIHKLKQINEFKDLSRKSSVDEYIQDLIDYINTTESYFTTSSCSGIIGSRLKSIFVLLKLLFKGRFIVYSQVRPIATSNFI